MYPELFSIFGYTISTFGLMLAVAFLVGSWITGVRMEEEGLDREHASTLLIYVIVGGILGSKLYFAVDVSIRDGRPFSELFFARDGITWYGGLILATITGAIGCRIHGIPVKIFAN
ncbi:MAG: prolipoprotein diacylglyceryl transferase, partial [Deltaproteobacteria bacterium]|nr:prolipoprotein diacylglyceryl transferase [Deltaproteobacteria bacterium]